MKPFAISLKCAVKLKNPYYQLKKTSVNTDFETLVCTEMKSFFYCLSISVNRYTDFQKMVYTDFIDWLIFSGHCFFSVHQFLKISVNRYTDFLSTSHQPGNWLKFIFSVH